MRAEVKLHYVRVVATIRDYRETIGTDEEFWWTGAAAEWTGNGNTDADGSSTSDISITISN